MKRYIKECDVGFMLDFPNYVIKHNIAQYQAGQYCEGFFTVRNKHS